jgi:adenylate kinase family enzyme
MAVRARDVSRTQEPPEQRYVLAVGGGEGDTLGGIVGAISKGVGTGEVGAAPADDVMLLSSAAAEYMSVDLKLESAVMPELGLEWVCEDGMVASLATPIAEYREHRNLLPICVFVHGPPASGTGAVASSLAKQYKLHHLTRDGILAEALEAGDKLARQLKRSQAKGKLKTPLLLQAARRKLNAPAQCNQGYVLEGFPETHQQALHLFKKLPSVDDVEGEEPEEEEPPEWVDEVDPKPEGEEGEEAEEEEEEEEEEAEEGVEPPKEGRVVTPAHLVVLEASDEELQASVKEMSEADIVRISGLEDFCMLWLCCLLVVAISSFCCLFCVLRPGRAPALDSTDGGRRTAGGHVWVGGRLHGAALALACAPGSRAQRHGLLGVAGRGPYRVQWRRGARGRLRDHRRAAQLWPDGGRPC